MKICIVGAGSIGKRHIENLTQSGEDSIQVIEPDISKWWEDELLPSSFHATFDDLSDDPADKADGAIICTPTHLHSECALPFLEQGIPVLIEKPLSHDLKSAIELAPHHRLIKVGYTLRNAPYVQAIKDSLDLIGKPLFIEASVGQYLPDWHPDEDYRDWYMAHWYQGGGAALDLSHEIDLVQHLMNSRISNATGFSVHISDLEISSDDLTEIHGRFTSGVRFRVHMDLIDRKYHRSLKIIGSLGTVVWDSELMTQPSIFLADRSVAGLAAHTDRNIQFVRTEQDFMAWVASGRKFSPSTLAEYDEAFHTLEVAIGIRDNGRFSFE